MVMMVTGGELCDNDCNNRDVLVQISVPQKEWQSVFFDPQRDCPLLEKFSLFIDKLMQL